MIGSLLQGAARTRGERQGSKGSLAIAGSSLVIDIIGNIYNAFENRHSLTSPSLISAKSFFHREQNASFGTFRTSYVFDFLFRTMPRLIIKSHVHLFHPCIALQKPYLKMHSYLRAFSYSHVHLQESPPLSKDPTTPVEKKKIKAYKSISRSFKL